MKLLKGITILSVFTLLQSCTKDNSLDWATALEGNYADAEQGKHASVSKVSNREIAIDAYNGNPAAYTLTHVKLLSADSFSINETDITGALNVGSGTIRNGNLTVSYTRAVDGAFTNEIRYSLLKKK
ncbi:MAG: hypothetical protein U0T32_04710 [Chitinophagales bacterium]|jgi:hypothetical protein